MTIKGERMKARDDIALYNRILRHRKGISKKYISKYSGVEAFSRTPWGKTYFRIRTRCFYDKNSSYYKRKIPCSITPTEIKELWIRDKAYLLNKPSIDRIKNSLGYIKENCRFIELTENL